MEYKLDVRLNQQAYEKHDLPPKVTEMLLALMRQLGLEYGAIDLRLDARGRVRVLRGQSGGAVPVRRARLRVCRSAPFSPRV